MDSASDMYGSEPAGWVVEPVKKSLAQRKEELEAFAELRTQKPLFDDDERPGRFAWYLASALLIGAAAMGVLMVQPLGCVRHLLDETASYQSQMACRTTLSSDDYAALDVTSLASISPAAGTARPDQN